MRYFVNVSSAIANVLGAIANVSGAIANVLSDRRIVHRAISNVFAAHLKLIYDRSISAGTFSNGWDAIKIADESCASAARVSGDRMTERVYDWNEITPEVVRIWAYDEDLMLSSQDEDLLLYDFKLIPVLVELADDKACPKSDYAFDILCQFCREQVTRGGTRGVNALKQVLEALPVQSDGPSGQWYDYVNRLIGYHDQPKPLSQREANQLAQDLLVGLTGRVGVVSEAPSPDHAWWRFTLKTSVTEHIDVCIRTGSYRYVPYY